MRDFFSFVSDKIVAPCDIFRRSVVKQTKKGQIIHPKTTNFFFGRTLSKFCNKVQVMSREHDGWRNGVMLRECSGISRFVGRHKTRFQRAEVIHKLQQQSVLVDLIWQCLVDWFGLGKENLWPIFIQYRELLVHPQCFVKQSTVVLGCVPCW